jgi:hypothetical protein
MPATLQLTSQQLQQFGFQQFQPTQIQAQSSQNTATQQFQLFSPQTITTPVTMATTTTLQTNTTASQTQTVDEPDDGDDGADDSFMDGHMDTSDEVEDVKPRIEKVRTPVRKIQSQLKFDAFTDCRINTQEKLPNVGPTEHAHLFGINAHLFHIVANSKTPIGTG